MTSALLEVRSIDVVYQRSIRAVNGVSLSVFDSQTVAILGANGAGKTSTMRAISGFIGLDRGRVAAGTIVFKSRRIENLLPHTISRQGISIVPEREKIFPNLTVEENMSVPRTRLEKAERKRLQSFMFDIFPQLRERRNSPAGLLSGGERQMLAIATKILCGPELLLVDELSLGLAPIVVQELSRSLKILQNELSLSILLVEQNAAVALQISDYAYVFENGTVAFQGDAKVLLEDKRIELSYLGDDTKPRRSNC